MIDFEAMRRDRQEMSREARETYQPGIDPAELSVGMKVTISPNLSLGDRSYTSDIHTVVAVNSTHVQTRIKRYDRPIILLVNEHYFYSASGFEE